MGTDNDEPEGSGKSCLGGSGDAGTGEEVIDSPSRIPVVESRMSICGVLFTVSRPPPALEVVA